MVESWLAVEPQINKTLYRPKNFLRCFVFCGAGGADESDRTSLHPYDFKSLVLKNCQPIKVKESLD